MNEKARAIVQAAEARETAALEKPRAKQFLVTFVYDADTRWRCEATDLTNNLKVLLESAAESHTDGSIPNVKVLPLGDFAVEQLPLSAK